MKWFQTRETSELSSEIKGSQGSHNVCGLICILNNTNKRYIGIKDEENVFFFVANLSFSKGVIANR